MQDNAATTVPQETGALIEPSPIRCHEMHGASLVPQAERVDLVHAGAPEVPMGIARAPTPLAREMEDHMTTEESILFRALRAGGGAGTKNPTTVMRADHSDHAENIALIRKLTKVLAPPAYACGSWRSLHGGTATLLDQPAAHVAPANDFPRFARVA